MIKWTEEQQMVRDAVRQFVEAEVATRRDELEFGDTPPYEVLRKLYSTFGMDSMAADRFDRQIAFEKSVAEAIERGDEPPTKPEREGGGDGSITMIPIIELCRHSPGLVTALGVSTGLTAAAINAKGTIAQKERWARDLLTLEKIGAWAITEPNSGSDAFGSMKATARRDGDEYVLNGSKTFITNGPYADTIVFICKLDEGNAPEDRKVLSFVLDSGMPGLEQSKPLRKMGMHSSPTGELFLDDVRVGKDRLIGETEDVDKGGRDGAKATFLMERAGVAAMALGMIERCLELSVAYAKERAPFGKPLAANQAIQFPLVELQTQCEMLRTLIHKTAWIMDTQGNWAASDKVSMCNYWANRLCCEAADRAIQVHGGLGYSRYKPFEHIYRHHRRYRITEGTEEIQMRRVAGYLFGFMKQSAPKGVVV